MKTYTRKEIDKFMKNVSDSEKVAWPKLDTALAMMSQMLKEGDGKESKINKGLKSSNTAEWATPQEVFDILHQEFHFTLDPCATNENAKCRMYYNKDQDGLSHSWDGYRVFMNPPYGREINKWMKKAYESKGLVVCLVPARTDTKWWHDYAVKGEVRFVKGRIKFSGNKWNAPFPSAIVIFKENSDAR